MTTAERYSEAEHVVKSEIVKEVLFLRQVQAFIMPAFECNPFDIVEDNHGAIKMANSRHSSKRTRHNHIKHHILRDAVDEGFRFSLGIKRRAMSSAEYHGVTLP